MVENTTTFCPTCAEFKTTASFSDNDNLAFALTADHFWEWVKYHVRLDNTSQANPCTQGVTNVQSTQYNRESIPIV